MPLSPVYCATKAALRSFTQSLRVQLGGTGVTVVELAPPGVETPLFRGEFAEEMEGQKGMDVGVLAKQAIAGIEAGKLEIRPGLSNVLKTNEPHRPGVHAESDGADEQAQEVIPANEPRPDHAAYVASWLKVLKSGGQFSLL